MYDPQKVIDDFRGQYAFLSNFSFSLIERRGIRYMTVEHAFQAAKTRSRAEKQMIAALRKAREAKEVGNAVQLRPDWEKVKVKIMRNIVRQKFSQTPALIHRLIATYPARLVEGNTWNDTFWGVCRGKGKNWLGIILMEIREELMEQFPNLVRT